MSRPPATLRLRGSSGPIVAHVHHPETSSTERLVVAFVDPSTGTELCTTMSAPVIAIDPGATADMRRLLEWIAVHAAELGGSTDGIAVTGTGAGATQAARLVAAAALAEWPPLHLLDCETATAATATQHDGRPTMSNNSSTPGDDAVPQGDLRLLTSETAVALLHSTIPARLAFIATDSTPRIVPTWFHWTGSEAVMGTFVAAPHVTEPAARVRALRANPAVAVTIDTNTFPPRALTLRGDAVVTEHEGIVVEYAHAAQRYLGGEAADYLAMLDDPSTVMARIALRPTWVGLIDFHNRMPRPLGGVRAATTTPGSAS